jgi:hypothetical protein
MQMRRAQRQTLGARNDVIDICEFPFESGPAGRPALIKILSL